MSPEAPKAGERIPIPDDQVTPEMRAAQAKRELSGQMINAMAENPAPPGQRHVVETHAADERPLAEGAITSVPLKTTEQSPAVEQPPVINAEDVPKPE